MAVTTCVTKKLNEAATITPKRTSNEGNETQFPALNKWMNAQGRNVYCDKARPL